MTSYQDAIAASGYEVFFVFAPTHNSKSKIMKHWYTNILISAVCLAGCAEKDIQETPQNTVFTAGIQTKTALVENSNSVNWSSGDAISIFSSAATETNAKFESSDISADRTEFSGTIKEGDTYYAIYPYSSGYTLNDGILTGTLPGTQTATKGSFADKCNPAFAQTADKTLSFSNLCGLLRVNIPVLSSPVTKITLTGNDNEVLSGSYTINVDAEVPAITMDGNGAKELHLEGEFKAGSNYYFIVPPVSFTKGYRFTFHSEGKTSEHNVAESTEIVAGKINDTGSLQIEKPENDLSAAESANCYIVSAAGSYSFKTLKGNSPFLVEGGANAEVLWETFGTDETPAEGDLIRSVDYYNNYIIFETADEFKEGNAVIALKNKYDEVVWSWHIWFTDKPAEHTYANNAGTMMDRNLGATSATPGDVGALGLFYQWGRKDPFVGSSSISSWVPAASTNPWTIKAEENGVSIDFTIMNPTTLVVHTGSTGRDWKDTPNGNLWNINKSTYDPCPPGWRVPTGGTNGVWATAGFPTGNHAATLADTENRFGILFPKEYCGAEEGAWYPAGGILHYIQHNNMNQWVGNGMYASCTTDSQKVFYYRFHRNGTDFKAHNQTNSRGFSYPVRCQKLEF